VPPAEDADEDGPEYPARTEVDERDAHPRTDAGDEARLAAQQRIGDVAAVELADRHEVEGGHEQPEPGGETQLADDEGPVVGDRPVDEARDPLEGEWLAEEEAAGVGSEGLHRGRADPEPQDGQADHEPGEGPRDPDVEEGAAVGSASDANKGPGVPTMLSGCQIDTRRPGTRKE
jgi:hypothetical protein